MFIVAFVLSCFVFIYIILSFKIFKVHNEREMDRVLGIDGIELIGINNRDLGEDVLK